MTSEASVAERGQLNPASASSDAGSPDVAQSGSLDDNIERLKAALDEDPERAKEPAPQLGGDHDVRVRVESLLDRAKRLFASGKLREARQTAQIAHDLGDTARLDFSPDEERPVDLLHQIDDQINEASQESAAAAHLASVTSDRPSSATDVSRDSTIPNDQPRAAAPEDAATRSRTRRDWTQGLNVFRRERKPNPDQHPGQPVPIPVAVASTSETVPVQLSLEVGSETTVETNSAVVQANRSVTLAVNSSAKPVNATASPQGEPTTSINNVPASDGPMQDAAEPKASSNSESTDSDRRLKAPWTRDAGEDVRRLPVADEEAPTDFDEVTPIARFHDVAQKQPVERVPMSLSQPVDSAFWGWLAGLIAFGTCGLVAIFWYRRGTT